MVENALQQSLPDPVIHYRHLAEELEGQARELTRKADELRRLAKDTIDSREGNTRLSVDQAAAALGVCRDTIYRKIASGDLEAIKIGKEWRVRIPNLRVSKLFAADRQVPGLCFYEGAHDFTKTGQ